MTKSFRKCLQTVQNETVFIVKCLRVTVNVGQFESFDRQVGGQRILLGSKSERAFMAEILLQIIQMYQIPQSSEIDFEKL